MAIVAALVMLLFSCATVIEKPPVLEPTLAPEEIPLEIRPYIQKAENAFKNERFSESLRLFDIALTKDPRGKVLSWICLRKGQIFATTGQYGEALEVLGTIPQPAPNDSIYLEGLYWQGFSYMQLGSYSKSIEILLALKEKETITHRKPEIEYMLGDNYRRENRLQEALISYTDVLDENPPASLLTRAKEQIEEIIETLTLEDLENIRKECEHAYPGGFILIRLSALYAEIEEFEKAKMALADFFAVHQEHPGYDTAESLYRMIIAEEEQRDIDKFSIGCIVPLSGRYAPYGSKVLDALKLAMGIFDSVSEHPVRLVVRDSKSDPSEAARAVELLATQDRVIAIMGPLGSTAAISAAHKAHELKVPIITLTQHDTITTIGEYVFRNFLTSRKEIQNLVSYALYNLGVRHFAVLYPDTSYGSEIMNLFWDEVVKRGGEIRAAEAYDENTTDFGEEIKRLTSVDITKKAKEKDSIPIVDFDALFIVGSAIKAQMIAPQLAFYNVEGIRLLGMSSWNTQDLLDGESEYLEGAVFTDVFFQKSYYHEVIDFMDRFYTAYGRVPDGIEALSYDAARIVADIINEGNANTRREMRDRLLELRNYRGVTGITDFSETGDAEKELYILTILDGEIIQIR